MLQISDRFAAQCSTVISSNYDTCGTVTRATVANLNLTQLNALFSPGGLFADLDAFFMHSIEMKACGTRRYALYDWIMANADREVFRSAVSGTKIAKSGSLLHPFILAKQESVVNRDHWKLVNGIDKASYTGNNLTQVVGTMTSGPLTTAQLALTSTAQGTLNPQPAGDYRIIRVQSRWGIPMDANWFRSRETLHLFTRRANGQSEHTQVRVLAAAVDTALTYIDVYCVMNNGLSSEAINATPGQGATTGIIVPGVNNVNDFEAWCQNLPTIDPRKRVPFWVQNFRTARCVDSEYKKVYKKLYDANPAFREFGDLDLSERNRQDELEMQKRFVNEFFYNKAISTSQTLSLWENLEAINSVAGNVLYPAGDVNGIGGKIMARRANFIGVREQLRQCDRFYDLANNPINMYEFLQLNYDIARARKTVKGRRVTDIDWYTNAPYRAAFMSGMVDYYNKEFAGLTRYVIEQGKMNEMGMLYDSYKVKFPSGININLISDEYFDDFRDEHDNLGITSRGNLMLCLDIGKPGPSGGTIYWAQIAANRVVHTTADINELAKFDSTYRCVMDAPSITQSLMSQAGTAVVECPLVNAWLENFTDDKPVTSGKVTPYSNLY